MFTGRAPATRALPGVFRRLRERRGLSLKRLARYPSQQHGQTEACSLPSPKAGRGGICLCLLWSRAKANNCWQGVGCETKIFGL
jgi:hypothetical protein